MQNAPNEEAKTQLRCREMLERLPDSLVFVLDADLRVVFAGGSLLAKSRFRQQDMIGKGLQSLVPPAALLTARPHLAATFGGEERSYELVYPTGEVFDVRTAPFLEDDGSISEILVVALEVTAHKQAITAERQAQEQLQLVIHAAKVGLWDWDLATNRVHYSPEWKQQLGYLDSEIGDSLDEWETRVHPADCARAKATVLAYIAAPSPNFQQEFRMRHKDGTYRHILAQGALFPGQDGNPGHMVGSHIDVTEQKLAAAAQAESTRLAQATLDGLSAQIAILDAEGTILAVNRAWREFAAANPPIRGNVHEGASYVEVCRAAAEAGCGEARLWLDSMRRVLAGETELATVEYPCHSPDEEQWFVARITRLVWDGAMRLVVAHENITPRVQMVNALLHSEAALKRSQAVAHVGHWTWDTRTNTVTWSDEMKRIFGLDAETFAGNLDAVIDRAIHPADAERVRALNANVVHKQQPAEVEYRVVWPDGSVHHVWAMPADRVLDADGHIIQLSGVVQDITQRKQTEALQLQFERQERLAAVGQLAAGIAHDFNNIMSVITIYAELMSEAPGLSEKDRARTLTIMGQAQRATRMIRQILDFSRQSVFELRVMDLLPLLKEQEKLLKQTLPESIEVSLDYRRDEYFVLADPTRMQQLVMNLAVNARDAMPNGGKLNIVLRHFQLPPNGALPAPEMKPGLWVQVDVVDTGSGIAPEVMAHIFEPFFTTKGPGKGTGLGLAQAHGIVAQHAGHLVVTSEVGMGTTFSVFLPAHLITDAADGDVEGHLALLQGHGEKILVVEDDVVLRSSLVELLQEWNYGAVSAANGEAALAYLTQPGAQVDAILSDVVMPRLGGIGLLKALRTGGDDTPVILMSGHPLGEETTDLKAEPQPEIVAWLEKPPRSEVLAKTLRLALDDLPGGRDDKRPPAQA